MVFLVCIDDTDTIDSIGTGTICEYIRDRLIQEDLAQCTLITRHQLLIHEDIPYTSHNSSMCFTGSQISGDKEAIISTAIEIVEEFHALGSDPGIAVAFLDTIDQGIEVVKFGLRGTKEVLTKEEAYAQAKASGIHLSEHGGTGQGVIGALAGIGLRMSGQYGEVKGLLKKVQNTSFTVKALMENHQIERVLRDDGQALKQEDVVYVEKQTKVMMKDNQYTLLVNDIEGRYVAVDRGTIRNIQIGQPLTLKSRACKDFKADVEEEQLEDNAETCYNCTYRRWEMQGFSCTL